MNVLRTEQKSATLVDGGDHLVTLSTMVAVDTAEGRPLTCHGRVARTHAALEVTA